jgi:hypothetical protein
LLDRAGLIAGGAEVSFDAEVSQGETSRKSDQMIWSRDGV